MKKSLLLAALLLASPVFADEVKSGELLTLASADTSVTVSLPLSNQDDLASDSEQEVRFYGRLLSAKIAAELPERLVTEAAVNVKF